MADVLARLSALKNPVDTSVVFFLRYTILMIIIYVVQSNIGANS